MTDLKEFVKNFSLTRGMYEQLRNEKNKWEQKEKLKGKYSFTDRRKNQEKLCIILAGYKDFVWHRVFERITKNLPADMDVCIVSSGLYSKELEALSKNNNWSYLSVERNCVTLAQNIAIHLHPSAQFIYKIDEDIFITEHFFTTLMNTYNEVLENGHYEVGFIAPIIPINGYGHVRLLKKLDLVDVYEKRFERVIYASRPDRKVEKDPEVAKFFWNYDSSVGSIDELDSRFYKLPLEYHACPIRFSIGAILLPRKTWQEMGMFSVHSGPCMGLDEEQLDSYCMIKSKAMIVSENTVVGHLSFGQQNKEIKKFYLEHGEFF